VLDVLVTCLPHGDEPVIFPQVRGYYLAKYLARSGLRAEFRQLPQPSAQCEVLICSEYQDSMEGFERRLSPYLAEIRADRLFCLSDYSLHGKHDHFSQGYCEWFGKRGGVLCHLPGDELEPYETWIGLGVDTDVIRPDARRPCDGVLFDFPRSNSEDASSDFDTDVVATLHHHLPGVRVAGSGPSDMSVKESFDDWVDYGQPHPAYVSAAFSGMFALVPGLGESMGLALAEAQVAGLCIVSSEGQVKDWVLCPEASVLYEPGEALALARALSTARSRNPRLVREQAAARFDFRDVVTRTRHAIGL
jgi:hypothetical protein